MASESHEVPTGSAETGRRLESWKEIAGYFERNERTVRRWEELEGLPVHRHLHDKRGTVFAYTAELDVWRERRSTGLKPSPAETGNPRRRVRAAAILGVVTIGGLAAIWSTTGRDHPKIDRLHLQPLTAYPGSERNPSFSPDGNQVAFSWDGGRHDKADIYVKTIGIETPHRITTDPADELSPSWSPGGRWIAFLRILDDTKAAVCLISSTGGEERQLAEVAHPPREGTWGSYIAWSPDNAWLITPDKLNPAGPFGLVRIAVANGAKRKLTSPALQHGDVSAAVPPSGRTVAFIRRTSYATSELYLMPIGEDFRSQPAARPVTSRGRLTTSPAWTPDGRHLLFLSTDFRSGETELWRTAASDGTSPALVTKLGERASHLTISAQRRLAFTRRVSDSNVWRLQPADGQNGRREWTKAPLMSSTRKDRNGQYSPDGKYISFESDRSGTIEIWRSERDGSGAVQLTHVGGPDVCCSRWSPDGRQLVFVSYSGGRAIVYVVGADGGAPQAVTDRQYNSNTPSWSNDGRWIYFNTNRSGTAQIWKAPAGGGEPVQVTRDGGVMALEAPDGNTLYYTKGGAQYTSLWSTPLTGGQEKQVLDRLVAFNTFAVLQEGIYLLLVPDSVRTGGTLSFLDFHTRRVQTIATIDQPLRSGLSILPDLKRRFREILYTQSDHEGNDLVISEYPR